MKILDKLRIKGNFLSLIKSIYKNPTANNKLNGKIFNGFPLRSGRRKKDIQEMLLPFLFNTVLKVLSLSIRQEKDFQKASKLERKK